MPFITGEGDREILQIRVLVVGREREPPARPDLADAKEQAHAAEGEEQHVPELPPLPDPQPEAEAEAGVDRAGAGARALEEPEPEVAVLVVVEAGGGRLGGVPGRAPEAVAPRRARGADLELDLAAAAALERVCPARHRGAPGGHAGAVQALVVVVAVQVVRAPAAARGPGTGGAAGHGLVPHAGKRRPSLQDAALAFFLPGSHVVSRAWAIIA